jgi:hypothetical protein
VTNLEDHAVTVQPRASASSGLSASAIGGRVSVPAHTYEAVTRT